MTATWNLAPGTLARDTEGGVAECVRCGEIGPVDWDGNCETCAEEMEEHDYAVTTIGLD